MGSRSKRSQYWPWRGRERECGDDPALDAGARTAEEWGALEARAKAELARCRSGRERRRLIARVGYCRGRRELAERGSRTTRMREEVELDVSEVEATGRPALPDRLTVFYLGLYGLSGLR